MLWNEFSSLCCFSERAAALFLLLHSSLHPPFVLVDLGFGDYFFFSFFLATGLSASNNLLIQVE